MEGLSMLLPRGILEEKLRNILAEDVGQGDVTTALVVPENSVAQAVLVAREKGVVAGIEEARILLESLQLETKILVSDGENVRPGQKIMKISGNTRNILSSERTVLNIMSRMSGIATATRFIVEKLHEAKVKTRVACTRKTAPGLLYFDKKAVLVGGGDTHRLHLDDLILIKDNHIAVVGSVEEAVRRAKQHASFTKKIEVEVAKAEDALVAATAGADVIMLDNFSLEQVEKALTLLKKTGLYGKVMIEVSGGITSENVLEYARKQVDVVSIGEITNSAKALDIGLDIAATTRTTWN
jgi:nicotinate-nucleotide pyrophosphorylase (carboxylating)